MQGSCPQLPSTVVLENAELLTLSMHDERSYLALHCKDHLDRPELASAAMVVSEHCRIALQALHAWESVAQLSVDAAGELLLLWRTNVLIPSKRCEHREEQVLRVGFVLLLSRRSYLLQIDQLGTSAVHQRIALRAGLYTRFNFSLRRKLTECFTGLNRDAETNLRHILKHLVFHFRRMVKRATYWKPQQICYSICIIIGAAMPYPSLLILYSPLW